jgi:hypothetical protein
VARSLLVVVDGKRTVQAKCVEQIKTGNMALFSDRLMNKVMNKAVGEEQAAKQQNARTGTFDSAS